MANNISRKYDSSPSFKWTNDSEIAEGYYTIFSWAEYKPESQKYLPFNFTRIINNTSAFINLYPNQDNDFVIPIVPGGVLSIDRRILPAVGSWRIESDSGTAEANKLIITNSREAIDSDSIVTKLFKRVIRFF